MGGLSWRVIFFCSPGILSATGSLGPRHMKDMFPTQWLLYANACVTDDSKSGANPTLSPSL